MRKKQGKCYTCGKALEFDGICYECSLPYEKRIELKQKKDKQAIKRFSNFIKRTFN